MKRKLLSIVLALTMALGMLPAAALAEDQKGTESNPYSLEELGAMTRDEYIAAQKTLGGTMYVTVGDYSYETNGTLGHGVRNDTTGQKEDRSVLNGYNSNGYLGEKNDGANGKNIVFVGGKITSGATGYTSIDKIGTSLLLAVPAYTNVTFEGTEFNNVMSFDYQLYTGPWSQLGELKFDGCTFNGIIVGAIAAQTLTFNGCEFKNYTNTTDANSSNPTWIRPAYGNWTKGDNEGQGDDFRSLTTINFTGNTVTSTRPVKFEYISQWDITSTVTATGNTFDITAQPDDTSIKNVGLYLGAHTDENEFHLVAENNKKSEETAALYTIPKGQTSLPAGSTVKDSSGNDTKLTDALEWKTANKLSLETNYVAEVGGSKYPTLATAVAAAKDDETVTLLKDTDISKTGLTIYASKTITLDLSGHSLKAANTNNGNIKVLGTLILTDSTDTAKNGTGRGKVYTETPYSAGSQDKVLIAAIDGGTFIMESGLIDAASFTEDNANKGQFAVSVQNENDDAAVTINGGHIKAGWYAVAGNGQDKKFNGNITVNGGILESTADYAIYHPHAGTTTINGGTVYGAAGGVSLNRGKLVVNGGTITSKGTGTTGDWGDGTGKQDAAAINVNAQYEKTSVEIKGGTITAERDAILLTNGKDGTIAVSGGTFSSAVKPEYCAPGFDPTQNDDGTYGVKIKEDMAAEVLDAQGKTVGAYNTLTDAIAAAKDGDTVTLLKDAETTVELSFTNKAITLDLNGKTVSGTFTDNFSVIEAGADASLTVQDTSVAGTGKIASDKYGISARDGGALIVKSGTIESEYAPLSGNNTAGDMNFTVNGGTLTAKHGPAIYMPGQVNLIITDGVLNGGISLRMGQVSVSGGTINAATDGLDSPAEYYHYSGNAWLPDALYVFGGTYTSENTTYGNSLHLNITGGTFNCANGQGSAVAIYDLGKVAQTAKVTISGDAKLATNAGGRSAYDVLSLSDIGVTSPKPGYGNTEMVGKVASAISGGTFSSEVKPEYCAEGYIPKDNGDGTYGVTRPSSSSSSRYNVTAPKADHGTVTVSPKRASKGDTVTVTVKPDSGYVLETLTVTDKNGNELTLTDKGDGKYTFTMPRGAVTVKATFMEDNTVLNFFYDVPNDAYYYEAVKWAVEKGITSGVGNDLFGSNDPCTRAQIVTFLWRAAGSPEPKALSSFTDVPADAWYAKAVAWAVENGVTAGVGDDLFGSGDTCTRAQSVTFLFKALKATAKGQADFKDVSASDWYAKAVAWAVENGVTAGVGGGLFGSGDDCTRAQIVTFLFKAYQGK